MSQYIDQSYINEMSRLVRSSNKCGSHRNCIRLSPANSIEHERKKFEICWWLLKNKHQFITEAIFNDGFRADIFILDTGVALEILHTETDKQFKRKLDKYPKEIKVHKIRSDEKFEEDLIY